MRFLVMRYLADKYAFVLTLLLGILLGLDPRAFAENAAQVRAATAGAANSVLSSPLRTSSQYSGPESSLVATGTPSKAATPGSSVRPVVFDRAAVLNYLDAMVKWRQRLAGVARSVRDPGEALFASDDRRLANEALQLSFDFARAAAKLLHESTPSKALSATPVAAGSSASGLAGIDQLNSRRTEVQEKIDQLKARLKSLTRQLSRAATRDKTALNREIIADQAQLELEQSRSESIDAMIAFQQTTASASSYSLEAEIDELQRSSAPPSAGANRPTVVGTSGSESALVAGITDFLALVDKQRTLAEADARTQGMLNTTALLHQDLLAELNDIDAQGLARTLPTNTDLAQINQTRQEFEQLTQRGKLLVDAALPLSKEIVTLRLYSANLARWRERAQEQARAAFRELTLRGSIFGTLLAVLFVASILWRRLTLRYVQDLQRRYQSLQLRRFVFATAFVLILIFTFANGLGSFATFMGFAAAGIAVALQNVILSIAGYFFLSGRFGIRAGDRVQIAGVNGDVLEIGFFKMTLMEVVGDERGDQPTGRAVIFPNSVVFQPTSNFFRQLPGTNFVWKEMRFTLAPDCDYRLAEKRLGDVVNEVYARYRDTVQREFHEAEDKLNLRLETPRPQTRLQLGPSGLEVVIRFPVNLRASLQISDDIARRLIDALHNEPGLRLATIGTPIIQVSNQSHPAVDGSDRPPARIAGSAGTNVSDR